MEERLSLWHVLAFVGELVLWAGAAYAGWSIAPSEWRWAGGLIGLIVVIAVWARWAAPRSPRRLAIGPRFILISMLGALTAAVLAVTGHDGPSIVVAAAALVIILAQARTESPQPPE